MLEEIEGAVGETFTTDDANVSQSYDDTGKKIFIWRVLIRE